MSKARQHWIEIAGSITSPHKYRAAAICAGIKPGSQKKDLAVLHSEIPAIGTALFTRNRVVAAPVIVSQKHLQTLGRWVQSIIVNSGNANACTGKTGLHNATQMAFWTARALGIKTQQVLVASTGVIGQPLPMKRIAVGLPPLMKCLSPDGGFDFSDAIMTTDTRRKICVVQSSGLGTPVTIAGTAKGSGMIHPRLATMLAFITTDAALLGPLLKQALEEAVAVSFNRVTIDGDTSTNDSIFLLANGASGATKIVRRNESFKHFSEGLTQVCTSLSRQIARDGEGARKLIAVIVSGGRTVQEADRVARSIANSPLVKTAMAGADANWGRILCAAGYSGVAFDPSRVHIVLNGLSVCRNGQPTGYDEALAKRLLEQEEIQIDVNLHRGNKSVTMWTCDFTEDYIRINASYRS